MIKKEKYLDEIRSFYDSDLVKTITGVRRCGKSVILKNIYDEIDYSTSIIRHIKFKYFLLMDDL